MKKIFLSVLLLFFSQKIILAQEPYIDLIGTDEDAFTFILPPANFESGLRTVSFSITYNTFTPEAQTAFQYAADIWSSVLNSNIPIKVNTYFTPLVPGLLGITLPNGRKNFPGAPIQDVWYSSCLANAIADSELNVGENDFDLFLNSNTNWYYGTDGNCPAGKYDLVSIVLHEMCHGLGFVGLAKTKDGLGSFGMVSAADFSPIVTSFPFPDLEGKPGIFDHFLVNSFEDALADTFIFPNNSAELDDQFTSNNIFFIGANALENNGNVKPRIYAPSTFSLGSSMVHLNEATYPAGNINDLMTPSSGTAEVTHNPGPIAIAMLEDIGWKVNYNVGIEEMNSYASIQIFPNPIEDELSISRNTKAIDAIEIFDLEGRKIIEVKEPHFPMNVSNLTAGIFFCKVKSDKQIFMAKFIMQK